MHSFCQKRESKIPNSNAKTVNVVRTKTSLLFTSVRFNFQSSPPLSRVWPKNIRCRVQSRYAALNKIPTDPHIAIHRGSKPFTLSEVNAPMRLNASAMNAEKPGKPREAKNAIITKAVYLGIINASPLKSYISLL